MIKRLYIFFLFISSWAIAQNPNFYSQVSKTKVNVGEIFQIAFTLEGQGANLVYPSFKDFDIYSGPNQSQSMSMVNGNFSQSTTISLFIAAKKEGKFTIGPASVMAGNQKLETKPITIEVIKTGSPQQQQSANSNAPANPQAQQTNPQEKNQYASDLNDDDFFVRAFLSKTKCYQGEQIHLSYKIYSRHQILDFNPKQLMKSFDGFWNENDVNTGPFPLNTEVVNGINYYVVEIYNTYLFAQRSGKITIDPIDVEAAIRKQTKRQPRNIFEQFFGTAGYDDIVVKGKSKPLKVEVIELPAENKPNNFSGAIGNFSYKAEITKNEVKANDAFNLKLTINGKGNIKLVDPLKLNLPESFEVYEPKVNETIKTNGGVSGSKTYDYLIIPREQGEYSINNLNFSYFDTDKKQYITLPSPEIKLTVLEGDASSAQVISPAKKGIKENENDIRYIKTGDLGLSKPENEFFSSCTHLLLLVLPTVLFFSSLFFIKRQRKLNGNMAVLKERKAAKIAKQQLVLAEKHMKSNLKDLFFNEVLNAIHKYLGNKFRLATADLSKEKISEMLISKQVSEATTQKLIETLDTCEFAKYAPNAVTGDLQNVYQETIELISQIEEQIKK